MEQSGKDLVIEQAKQLALTISLFNTKYDKLLSEFNNKLAKVYTQLNEDVSKSKETLSFLGENVAYQSNLESVKSELDLVVNIINENFNNYSLTHEHPYAMDVHHHNDYSTLDHVHDYVDISVYNSDLQKHTENFNLVNTYNDLLFKAITESLEEKYAYVLNSIETTNKELDEISKTLATSIDDVEFKLNTFKSNTKKDIKDLLQIIDLTKNNLAKDLDKAFSKLTKKVDDNIDEVYQSIQKVNDKLESEIDNLDVSLSEKLDTKSDKTHNHNKLYLPINKNFDDRYSKLDHTHQDILSSIDVLQEKNLSLEESIDTVFDEIKNKPEYSEILLKSDLIKLKNEIISEIPIPENGKDAEEWEFKPHPTQAGILIFKKQSDKNWNYINFNLLIPNSNHGHQQAQPQQLGGFGGGGGGSLFSILFNNNVVSHTTSLNFVGTAVQSVVDYNNVATITINALTSANFAIYKANIIGFNFYIPQTTHKILQISNVMVRGPNGKVMDVTTTIVNENVTLDSNLDLTGFFAILSGII